MNKVAVLVECGNLVLGYALPMPGRANCVIRAVENHAISRPTGSSGRTATTPSTATISARKPGWIGQITRIHATGLAIGTAVAPIIGPAATIPTT